MDIHSDKIVQIADEIRIRLEEEQKEEIIKVLGDKTKTPSALAVDLLDLSRTFSMKFTVLLLQSLSDDVS